MPKYFGKTPKIDQSQSNWGGVLQIEILDN